MPTRFDANSLDEKRMLRRQLKGFLRERISDDMPIIGFYLENEDDLDSIRHVLQGAASLGLGLVVFYKQRKSSGAPFDFYDQALVIFSDEKNQEELFSGCDAVVCFSNQAVKQCFSQGIVPIAFSQCSGAENYDPNRETGNSFVFEKKDPWHIFAALVRAMETYRFPFDWKWIMRKGRSPGNF